MSGAFDLYFDLPCELQFFAGISDMLAPNLSRETE
jgi:hypothetical protein